MFVLPSLTLFSEFIFLNKRKVYLQGSEKAWIIYQND